MPRRPCPPSSNLGLEKCSRDAFATSWIPTPSPDLHPLEPYTSAILPSVRRRVRKRGAPMERAAASKFSSGGGRGREVGGVRWIHKEDRMATPGASILSRARLKRSWSNELWRAMRRKQTREPLRAATFFFLPHQTTSQLQHDHLVPGCRCVRPPLLHLDSSCSRRSPSESVPRSSAGTRPRHGAAILCG